MMLRTDVYEHDGELVVAIEMPGVEESTIDVQIDRFVLTVRGRRPTGADRRGGYHRRERTAGPFRRDISLPTCVAEEARRGARTRLSNGVFTVQIPIDGPAPRIAESG